MRTLISACLLVASLAPAAASAQEGVDDPRLAAYLPLGFGGDADLSTDVPFVPNVSGGLDPTVGFGFRGEVPLHRYVVIGGSFELLTFDSDGNYDSEREEVFDFDVLVRARYPFEVSNDVWLEPYAMLPFGFSMAVLPEGDGDEVWPGWNIGVLAGLYVGLANAPVAFFLELGWRHHQVYTETTVGGNEYDSKIVTNQFAMQLGAALRLE